MKHVSDVRSVVLLAGLAWCTAAHATPAESLEGASTGSVTAVERARKVREGPPGSDQAERFRHPDPAVRIQALKALADAGDPDGRDIALTALDDADPRVQSKALECLLQLKAKDAAPALVQRMFLKGSSVPLRKRILATLGRLGDVETARQLLEYASGEPDPALRGAAISSVTRLADRSIAPALKGFADQEKDPGIQRMVNEALARMPSRTPQ